MDLDGVAKKVFDSAKTLGYKSEFHHDGEKFNFKLTSQDKSKKTIEFSLDDESVKSLPEADIGQAIVDRVEQENAPKENKAQKVEDKKSEEPHEVPHEKDQTKK